MHTLSPSRLPYLLVFLCGIGDAITTITLTRIPGVYEQNPFFVPFLSTLIFILALLVFNWKKLPLPREDMREIFRGVLVLVALSPVLNNLQVLVVAALH